MKTIKMFGMIVGLTMLMSSTAMAEGCSKIQTISGLTESTRQEMIVQCEQAKLIAPTEQVQEVVGNLDVYSDIALKFAQAVGIAARELGMAVNEFVDTPAGKLTVAIIAYQIFGGMIAYVLIGGLCLVLICRLSTKLRQQLVYKSDTYIEVTNIFGNKKLKE